MHMPSAFPILFGIIHVPFDSFISQNEGNAEPYNTRTTKLRGPLSSYKPKKTAKISIYN